MPLLMARLIAAVSTVAPSPLDVSASVLIALEISDTDLWSQRPSHYVIIRRQNPCGRLSPWVLDIFKPKGSTSGTIAKDSRSLGTRKRAAGGVRLSAGGREMTKKQ